MNSDAQAFFRMAKHPLKLRIFLFLKLPSAFFSGVCIKNIDEKKCLVTVPYKWFSQNPFRSTYFACLSMAAEMSTGVLAMACLYKRKPPVSMLVVKVESEYFKKATGRTTFVCEDGETIRNTIEESITASATRIVKAKSVGRNNDGDLIAEFFITWSFKAKSKN
jgi:hypothetical protein